MWFKKKKNELIVPKVGDIVEFKHPKFYDRKNSSNCYDDTSSKFKHIAENNLLYFDEWHYQYLRQCKILVRAEVAEMDELKSKITVKNPIFYSENLKDSFIKNEKTFTAWLLMGMIGQYSFMMARILKIVETKNLPTTESKNNVLSLEELHKIADALESKHGFDDSLLKKITLLINDIDI